MAIPYSRWFFNYFLISTLTFGGTMVGYSSMIAYFFDMTNLEYKYSVGFGLLAAISIILVLWTAYAITRHLDYANPGELRQKIYIVAAICIGIALIIISVVMLIMCTVYGYMAFYVVAIIWIVINEALGVLSLTRSVVVTETQRRASSNYGQQEQDVIVQN